MSTLACPSADFPRQPSVSLEVPEGWEPAHTPGTTTTARGPRLESFTREVVVGIEQCAPAFRVEDSRDEIRALPTSGGGATARDGRRDGSSGT